MPSTYAHYRFGNEILKCLPDKQKQIILSYPDLFYIGLHGPDLLFYYKPVSSNPVNRTGFGMHERPASEFFISAGKVLRDNQFASAHVAYIYGFLCHFALDRECHGYIDEKIASSGVSHVEIEAEFDRILLERDGFNPVSKKLTDHIHPSYESAQVISSFFEEISEKEVYKSIKSMVFYNNILCAPQKIKRSVIYGFLKLAGHEEIKGMIINYKPNPLCNDSNKKLMKLYGQALENAERLITGFIDSVLGKRLYDSLFKYTFGSQIINDDVVERELA